MAFCRFSSDDYRSDVYVFEPVTGGIETHVASTRCVPDRDLPDPVDLPANPTPEQVMARVRRDSMVMRIMAGAGTSPIGLPHDGERFFDFTPLDAIERLLELRDIGYNVPELALDDLHFEQLRLEAQTNDTSRDVR